MRLKGKVAIITGAASGIGRATALLFVKEGAKVVVADLDEAGGNEVIDQINSDGGEAMFVRTDVTSAADTQTMIKSTVDAYGKLDVMFNNAGIAMRLPVVELPEEDWDRCVDINLKEVFLGSKYAIPEMIKNGGGSIINMASIYGIVGGTDPRSLRRYQRWGRQSDAWYGTRLCHRQRPCQLPLSRFYRNPAPKQVF